MRAFLICLAGLAIAIVIPRASRATPGDPIPGPSRDAIVESGLPPHAASALDSVPHPWPGVALTLSAAGTAAPIVAGSFIEWNDSNRAQALWLLGAEVVTPSLGHLYAGLNRRATTGMVIRGVGFGIVVAAGASGGWWSGGSETDFTPEAVFVLLGTTMMAVSAVVDVVSVPGDVQKKNAEWLRAHQASIGLRLAPDATPELALTLRF